MTEESLLEGIKRLCKLRKETRHDDYEELKRINTKLDKLYDLQYILLQQKYGRN